MFWRANLGLAIIEDDNLVYTENCTGTGNLACQTCFLVVGNSIRYDAPRECDT